MTKYKTVVMDDFTDKGEVIRVHDDHSDLMITHREAAQDKRLEWKDRGLLWYLLSKPKDWQVRLEDLIAASPKGREEVQGILGRLQRFGYLERVRVKNSKGQFVGWLSKVSAKPIFATAEQAEILPQEATERPQDERKEAELPPSTPSKWHPDVMRVMEAFCGHKDHDYKDGWLGYKDTAFAANKQAANQMLKDDYTFEQIEGCYKWLKSGRAFYRDQGNPLTLMGVRKFIGEYVKQQASRQAPAEHFEPEGYALEMM